MGEGIKDISSINYHNGAIENIRQVLSRGKTLSHLLLEECRWSEGKVYTFLPTLFNECQAGGGRDKQAFSHWEPDIGEKTRRNQGLTTFILGFLEYSPRHYCIFEGVDLNASSLRQWIEPNDERIVTRAGEVYFLLGQPYTVTREKIEDTIWDADSDWHLVCLMSELDPTERSGDNNELEEWQLRKLAQRAKFLVVLAFGGSGFLLWCRKGAENLEPLSLQKEAMDN